MHRSPRARRVATWITAMAALVSCAAPRAIPRDADIPHPERVPESHRPFAVSDRRLVSLVASRQFVPTWHDRQQFGKCSQNPPCGGPDAFDAVVGTFLSIDRAAPP